MQLHWYSDLTVNIDSDSFTIHHSHAYVIHVPRALTVHAHCKNKVASLTAWWFKCLMLRPCRPQMVSVYKEDIVCFLHGILHFLL